MALHNEILVGRFNRALQKLFAIKGGPVSPQLGGEIMPVYLADRAMEDRFLFGWGKFYAGVVANATVGLQSQVQLRNPKNSNIMAVIEICRAYNGDNTGKGLFLSIGPIATDQAQTVTIGGPVDARQGNNAATVIPSAGVSAIFAPTTYAWFGAGLITNVEMDLVKTLNQEIPLPPGNGLIITSSALNFSLGGAFLWRERFLEDSERT